VGLEVDRERFSDAEVAAFHARLEESIDVLSSLLARPGFGKGEATLGAELEVALVDDGARPLPRNLDILADADDPRLTVEIERFNLECNLAWGQLAGRPFARLQAELDSALASLRYAAAEHGGRVVPIGILPTLTRSDFGEQSLTDATRYRALNRGLVEQGHGGFRIVINGDDALELDTTDVSYEGANTGFHLHLRVDPDRFADVYNAAQLATVPVLAAAGNSPTFLGQRLWEETRIALLKQAVDARGGEERLRHDDPRVSFGRGWLAEGALELFAESVELHGPLLPVLDDEAPAAVLARGEIPALRELRLHQGTVWRWNRAVYDAAEGGHLRLELRTLPSGPTTIDMAANAAFLVGLTLALAPDADTWTAGYPFPSAHTSFHAAARSGLEAELVWPPVPGETPEPVRADDLARRLLPLAREGLVRAGGVDPAEADALLRIVEERVAARQTGARWQRRALEALEPGVGRAQALSTMLERYMALSEQGEPVHRWPIPTS
jgi:gamma-glutamyl:cysteine ligase YbdK (ATP-grasp superfamily)